MSGLIAEIKVQKNEVEFPSSDPLVNRVKDLLIIPSRLGGSVQCGWILQINNLINQRTPRDTGGYLFARMLDRFEDRRDSLLLRTSPLP